MIRLVLALLIFTLLYIFLYYSMPQCSWVITNCCPEHAGANWECVDLRYYKAPECKENLILCPQVLSPKPEQECKAVPFNGCVVR